MDSILLLAITILAWSCIGIVPASLAGMRKKERESVYWMLVLFALCVEVLVAVTLLQIGIYLGLSKILGVIAPFAGAVAGALFYIRAVGVRDADKNMSVSN